MKTNPQDLNPRGFYFFVFFYMIIMECEDTSSTIYNITGYFSTIAHIMKHEGLFHISLYIPLISEY